nr:Smr/MutS family protein [Caldimonas sp.]
MTSPIKGRHLGELAALRAQLAERRRAEAARADAAQPPSRGAIQPAARKASESDHAFADAIGHVMPLRKRAHEAPARARPAARAQQRELDEAAALAESIAGSVDAEALLETDEALSFRRNGIGLDVVRKLRRGVWVLQDEIDLHGLRRDEAHERVSSFLRDASRAGFRCVRVVHGKGLGSPGREPVLKAKVKAWLVKHEDVLAFTHARPADGGHGALIVLLKANEKNGAPR